MPESRRSAETWPWRARSHSMTAASRASCAARLAWPPSVTSARSGGRKAPTPRPVPGPSTAIGSPGSAASPPPSGNRSARVRTGSDQDTAAKSFTTRTAPHAERRSDLRPVHHPVAVGQPRAVRRNRARHRQHRAARCPPSPMRFEEGADRVGDARVLVELDAMERADAAARILVEQREAPVGAADVRDEQRVSHGARPPASRRRRWARPAGAPDTGKETRDDDGPCLADALRLG